MEQAVQAAAQQVLAVAVGGAADVRRTLIATVVLYTVLVVVLRISGKRTLAKLNAFDLVITVAIGSVLASGITSADIPLLSTATAATGLAVLQWIVAQATVRWGPARRAVKAVPTLVVHDGRLLHDEMRRVRLTDSEVLQVLRQHGAAGPEDVAAVVLETDGSLSVVRTADPSAAAMRDVPGWGDRTA